MKAKISYGPIVPTSTSTDPWSWHLEVKTEGSREEIEEYVRLLQKLGGEPLKKSK